MPAAVARLGERGVLRQEAVAGVDRLRARLHGGGDDGVDVEVAARRLRRAEPDGDVGLAHVPSASASASE
jgi:hypothetical protein